MIFTEYRFLLFFALVLGVHWLLRNAAGRKVWLLAASYVFYGAWDWRFLSLIWISTVVDYTVGRRLLVEDGEGRRRALLLVSMTMNLGLLGFFKYFDFFVESMAGMLEWLGFSPNISTLGIILPVGISFYTFQTMSYTIDAYRRKLTPTRNFLDVALFVAFFPQLVAGPIVRAIDFMPQLDEPRRWAPIAKRAAITLFVVGFFKKAVIADNAAIIVEQYFSGPEGFSAWNSFLGVFAYSAQIYGDFSGYSDMAIACAALLGYTLPLNFAHPYLSINITDFWRRWHISLSTWLRDYLYVPLGGNRGSKLFTYRNLMLTMLLGGLWHGAAWRFIIWGGLHGLALIVHREYRARFPDPVLPKPLGAIVATLGTFWWVSLAWIFFRAQDMATAVTALKAYVLLQSSGSGSLSAYGGSVTAMAIALILLGMALAHVLNERRAFERLWRDSPDWAYALGLGLAIPFILALVPAAAAPFIYFQF